MLKLIRQYITTNANRLSSQLSDLEKNVSDETGNIRSSFEKLLTPTPVVTANKTGASIYTTGDLIVADTTQGAFAVSLTPPTDGLPGFAALINNTATGVTVSPIAPALINLSSSGPALAGGFWLLYWDTTNWWSK